MSDPRAKDDGVVDQVPGESDMITFEHVGKPAPAFRIEQIGDDPNIRYRYEWNERGTPTPEQFERVGHIEVKLVTMLTDLEGDVEKAAEAAHEAIVDLKDAMADERSLSDIQRQDVMLGNLDGLPEVECRIK